MIEPSEEDLFPFLEFKASDFERWLRVGLEGYFLENKGIWQFEHIAVFLNGKDYLVLDLAGIYRLFNSPLRAEFRQGVANLLANLEAHPNNVPLFDQLLLIAASLPAPEVLTVLPIRMGSGFFGSDNTGIAPSLFRRMFETVTQLAAPTDAALNALKALIGAPQFKTEYAGLALITLCRIKPDDFCEHMELMRPRLTAMFEQYRYDLKKKKRLADQIINSIGLHILAEALPSILFDSSCLLVRSHDSWLIGALVTGENPTLVLWDDGHGEDYIAWAGDMGSALPVSKVRARPVSTKPALSRPSEDLSPEKFDAYLFAANNLGWGFESAFSDKMARHPT